MNSIWRTLKSTLGAGSASARARRRRAAASTAPRSPYRACTIEPGQDACEAVMSLQEKRFLQVDVPLVPLPECGRLQCDCRYRRYEDRRDPDQERRMWGSAATQLYPHTAKERRRAFGRRAGADEY